MSDLISRQAAKDALAKLVPYAICDTSTESYTNGLTDAYNLICQLPSAQQEIVRCKDCKHWDRTDNLPEHYGECLDSVFGYCVPREDFFCKNGERRSE